MRSNWNLHLLFTAFNFGYVFDLEAKAGDLHHEVAHMPVRSQRSSRGDSMGDDEDVGLAAVPGLQGESTNRSAALRASCNGIWSPI